MHLDGWVYLFCIDTASGLARLLHVLCALLAVVFDDAHYLAAGFDNPKMDLPPCKDRQCPCRRQYMPLEAAEDGHATNAVSAGKIAAFKPYSPNRGIFEDYGPDEA